MNVGLGQTGPTWWYNNNVTNVTNKINPANWVLDESPNKEAERNIAWLTNYKGNVKTYRRKVANYNAARVKRARQR